ncbi:hypothetical protein NFI96_019593 [Prochilodus magdalenae]|nr:hypothetical protein NFI96_019593 [Prochilodus magdalenae]
MCLILHQMFGVMGVLLFGETVPSAFGDLTAALFTLFVCLTLDGWVDIQARFKDAGDESMYAAMAFFAVFICVGAFIFINLKITVLIANLHKVIEELEGPPEDSSPEVTHLEDVLDRSGQTPLTNLCFDSLTIEHLENALLVKKAVENTTKELEGLYDELGRIDEEVRAVPANRRHELELMRQWQAAATLEENILSSEVFSGRTGDILTTLMTLDEANIIDSSEDRPQVYSSGMIQKGVRRLSMMGAANSSSF